MNTNGFQSISNKFDRKNPLIDLLDDDNDIDSDNNNFNQPKLELNFDNRFGKNGSKHHGKTNSELNKGNIYNSQDEDEDMIDIDPIENPFANPDSNNQEEKYEPYPNNSTNGNRYYSFDSASDGFDNSHMELPPRTGYYKDFETIDWVKDINRDRQRHKDIILKRKSFLSIIESLLDSATGWFCVLLVGLAIGATAGIIDIGSTWMFDLKLGICREAFWMNKEQCCWTPNNTNFDDPDCAEWYSWSTLLIGKPISTAEGYFVGYLSFILWGLLFSGLAVRLVMVFAPYACGSGIPEIKTILSGFVIRGYLGKWTLIIKAIGMILAVSAGLSLGKEGPMVHMAVCWGNFFAYFFPKYGKNEAKKREIMSAAAAAGVAVAFGAPIGGVLFSLEEASYYFPLKTMFRSFFCAMVAANVLRLMNPFGNENLVMFDLDYKAQWHAIELILFAILGVFGGIFGIIFNKFNLWICSKRKTSKLGKYPCTEVALITLLTGIICFPQEYLRINSSELFRILVGMCGAGDNITLCDYKIVDSDTKGYSFGSYEAGPGVSNAMGMLTLALICKIVLTIFTFGIKVPCGLFIPSMTVGAIIGRIMGVGVEQWAVRNRNYNWLKQMCKSNEPCVNPGLYAIVGAAAALGGVTRVTVSLVVVMLEVTGGSNYIIPLMVATMVSKWTGDRLTHGIYDEHIKLNNYPYLTSENELTEEVKAADIMKPGPNDPPLKIITQDSMNLREIDDLVRNSTVNGFPVVVSYESQYLVGLVTRRDLEWAIRRTLEANGYNFHSPVNFVESAVTPSISSSALKTVYLKNILDMSPITVTDQTPLETVLDFFIKLGLRQLIVTQSGRLRGIITKKDILQYLNQSKSKLQKRYCFN